MSTFSYVARDSDGQRVTGTLAGASEQTVLAELQARNLAPVKVSEVRERGERRRRRISTRQLAAAYRQLSDLLRAGVPLLRALRLLGRSKSSPHLASIMSKIADAVADGDRLADAMAEHGDVFPSVQLAMIRAGERGSFLEQVLARMGGFLEHQADLRGRVIGNLIYPMVLLAIGLSIIVFALVVFVPKFKAFYSRIEVPLPTKILLSASELLTARWGVLLVVLVVVVAAAWWLLPQPRVRRWLATWQLRVPRLGSLVKGLAVARFTRILGTLLHNGVPLLSAMEISRDAAGHVLMVEAIGDAMESVRAGETLAAPLAESGMFSEDVVEMIAVGESANNLPEVLITIADTIEKRVDRMLAIFLRLMEPILLLAMAGVVLFIFVALIVPMLRMSASI